jgi:Niemann-Pick C1 protein
MSVRRLGFKVAEHPWKTILLAWISVLICCSGFLNFRQEKDPLKLWVPDDSQFLRDTHFIVKNYGQAERTQNFLITSENGDVLTPEVMQKISIISKDILSFEIVGEDGNLLNYEKICLK